MALSNPSTSFADENSKGYYATPSDLSSALPVGIAGWYAVVGSTDTFWIWDTTTSAWVDSGSAGGTGDMTKAVYDPTNKNVSAFNSANHAYTPSGNIIATTVESAINELDTEKMNAFVTEPTSQYVIDGQRTDTYTENGSEIFPFKTISAAVAHAVADGRNDSNPAWHRINGAMSETPTITHGGAFFTGANSSGTHSPVVLTGKWHFEGADGSLTANHFALQHLYVSSATDNAIHFTGNQAQRLFLKDVWLSVSTAGTAGLLADNTNATSVIEIDGFKVSHNAVTGDNYCLDISTCTVNVDDLETSGATQVAVVRSGALNISNSEIDANGDEAIHVHTGATLSITNSQVVNTKTNSSGLMLNTGAIAVLGNVNFNVPIGTGYAINGAAGSVCYYKSITFLPGSNTSISPNVTMIEITSVTESIAGYTGTMAQFNTACSNGDFVFGGGTSSGTNTGDETVQSLGSTINAASAATPNDTDIVATVNTSINQVQKITWTNVKAFLKTYFDTIYQAAGAYITASSTNTLTNKRVTNRIASISANGAVSYNTDNYDIINMVATGDFEMTSSKTGSPAHGDEIVFYISDNGSAHTITWGADFVATNIPLPTTTLVTTGNTDLMMLRFKYSDNDFVWYLIESSSTSFVLGSGTASGTNTGDETAATLGSKINAASAATPNDTDLVATAAASGSLLKITWTNVKAFLKTYFDTIYVIPNQDTTGKSAKTDALNSATTTVNVSSAAAPTTGQVLTATSSTAATWQDPTSGSSFTWNDYQGGTTTTLVGNNGYIVNIGGLLTATLPSTTVVGEIIRITGNGGAGWKIAQNASQSIFFGTSYTTTGTGGYIQSTTGYDAVELLCTQTNGYVVVSSMGNITIV